MPRENGAFLCYRYSKHQFYWCFICFAILSRRLKVREQSRERTFIY